MIPLFGGQLAVSPGAKAARYTALSLGARSPLFKIPRDGICTSIEDYIQAVNALAVGRRAGVREAKLPKSLTMAVSGDGVIRDVLEVLMFGRWLLCDAAPGLGLVPGNAADEQIGFRTVAVAAAELFSRERIDGQPQEKTALRTGPITRTDLRNGWTKLFGEGLTGDQPLTATYFKSRIKTAKRYLEAYLAHLSTQRGGKAGTRRRRSRHLEEVLRALSDSKPNGST